MTQEAGLYKQGSGLNKPMQQMHIHPGFYASYTTYLRYSSTLHPSDPNPGHWDPRVKRTCDIICGKKRAQPGLEAAYSQAHDALGYSRTQKRSEMWMRLVAWRIAARVSSPGLVALGGIANIRNWCVQIHSGKAQYKYHHQQGSEELIVRRTYC